MPELRSSPRPWGCFRAALVAMMQAKVFPTPVGVFLNLHTFSLRRFRLPHARGGVSFRGLYFAALRGSSPRPWGCFH